ncbi:ABC transporter substrate-binding protein [Massilia sp. TS11]|uniref:substrate-binding periplasmic protein n=1 Tax=Massilia sp. TS11 TaxID=2908003 RepID=UPI001EDC7AF0|nr:transporter substrate-binding domain-containing protein [Massilia sp. TS11]MCG2584402.1 transporter substrate-binding domain-containing protein [Massilia sp. TS11]
MRRLLALVLLCLPLLSARAAELVMLVDTGTDMPLARIEGGRVTGGIHADLAQALARHLGRPLRLQALPRKRMALALEEGSGDLLCLYLPEWMPGDFHWSQAFFPQAEVLLTVKRAARPRSISDVAGKFVGTVHGYHYPEMELALGVGFKRSDGPSTEINISKLAAGRIDYALTSELWFRWRQRQGGGLGIDFHPPLVVANTVTACALSKKSALGLAELNGALQAMQRDGSVAALLRRY